MKKKVFYSKMNKNGLTTIPSPIRKQFELKPDADGGHRMEITFKDGIITMRPVRLMHVPYVKEKDTSTGGLVPLEKATEEKDAE